MRKEIILLAIITASTISSEAQVFKGLGKRLGKQVERRVERKIERKAQQKTDEAVDEIFDNTIDKNRKKGQSKRSGRSTNENSDSKNRKGNQNNPSTQTKRNTKSAKDFVPGTQVVFQETFSRDAIGDFPVAWNTNSSGEVVTFNDDNTRWLKMVSKGSFTPDGIKVIPDNSTLEFDLTVDEDVHLYSYGFQINIVELKNRTSDFTKWTQFGYRKNGVRLWLNPLYGSTGGGKGHTGITVFTNGEQLVKNNKKTSQFSKGNNTVHVSLWRQKTRLRVYLNDEKIWDIPRAFGEANYNGVSFLVDTKREESYYVSNIRLAKAGADTRHKLLETGSFTTNDILFDVNRATIKPSSFKTLDEIGQVLRENASKRMIITGHTDSDGTAADNLKLSKRRAQSVKDYFKENFSIASSRLQVVGKGESQPIDAKNKSANRRVEFKLTN